MGLDPALFDPFDETEQRREPDYGQVRGGSARCDFGGSPFATSGTDSGPTRTGSRPTGPGSDSAGAPRQGPVAAGRAAAVRAVRAADDRAVLGAEGPPLLQLYPRVGRLRRAALPEPVGARRSTTWSAGRSWRPSSRRRWRRAWRRWPSVERERAELARHWQLRRERAGYEAERAARQYQACEPENRLVGRELERRWEEALKAQRQLEDEYERWQRTAPGRLSPDDERAIRSLAADLPAVWRAATTTPAERQRIARLLIEQVSVAVDKASERVDVELRWVGGPVESHTLSRPVRRYDLQSDYPRLVERLRACAAEGLSSAAIAERLNAEGFRPPKRADRFTGEMVRGS